MFSAIESQDHCAVVLDVVRELRGGVVIFIKKIRGGGCSWSSSLDFKK